MNAWLHRFAVLTAVATFLLVGLGGLVTSHGVGMAVPDWPNTYGYNMFFFPFSRWVGGIFYEHSHRLFASGVGLLTSILALWLYGRSARPLLRRGGFILLLLGLVTGVAIPRHWADGVVLGMAGLAAATASFCWPSNEPSPSWLRRLGLLAFFMVVLQGVLGGLRVVLFKDQIGILHATLAQLFFVLMCCLAIFTSPRWGAKIYKAEDRTPNHGLQSLVPVFLVTTFLILTQLVLGATMRHQHAGLAIPDFPLAYGKLWPAADPASVQHYNQHRLEVVAVNPITSFQIGLQMVHRVLALLILGAVSYCAWFARHRFPRNAYVSKLAFLWLVLVLIQVWLGAATIWSNKAADVATLHVLTGALTLAVGAMLNIAAYASSVAAAKRVELSSGEAESNLNPFGPRPAPAAPIK